MQLTRTDVYTIEDIYALPEGHRAELIDGQIYAMALPNTMHQRILMELSAEIRGYIIKKQGQCEVFPAPFAVFLSGDDRNYVEPDISVICDKNKIDDRGCNGPPDWVVEITSPSNPQMDHGIKLFKYRTAGVRGYWIINPQKKTIIVFDLEKEERTEEYKFEDDVPVCVYGGFVINIERLLKGRVLSDE